MYTAGHTELQTFNRKNAPHLPRIDDWQGRDSNAPRPRRGSVCTEEVLASLQPGLSSEFLRLAVKYGVPALALLQVLLLSQAASTGTEMKSVLVATAHKSPDCLTVDDTEDLAAERAQLQFLRLGTQLGSGEREAETVVSGVPITASFMGRSTPLSKFFLEKIEKTTQAETPFIVCEHTDRQRLLLEVQQAQLFEQAQASTRTENIPITAVTVPPYERDAQVFAPDELSMRLLMSPAEPTAQFFTAPDGTEYLLFMNNIGLQLYELQRDEKSLTLLKRTEHLPLFTMVASDVCSIWGDVFLTSGPAGEVGFVALDLNDDSSTCFAVASSMEEAITDGFQMYSVQWQGIALADYPTLALQTIQGQLHAVFAVNDTFEHEEGYAGQPLLLLPLGEPGEALSGVQFNNPKPFGSPASILQFPSETDSTAVQAIRFYRGYADDGELVQGIETYVADPVTQVMTITNAFPGFTLPLSEAICKISDTEPSRVLCLEQQGSTVHVPPMVDTFGKVTPVMQMLDGTSEIVHTALVTLDAEQQPLQSELAVTRLRLEADGTITQKAQMVLSVQDAAGNHISVTDNQVELRPDGSMVATVVGLKAYGANTLVRLEITPEAVVRDARILLSTGASFPGDTIARVGDYNGRATTEGLTVRTHYLAYGSVVAVELGEGYTLKIDLAVESPTSWLYLPFVSR